jgi:uncharacterized surface protein with fasciclin (FAS1) repeats
MAIRNSLYGITFGLILAAPTVAVAGSGCSSNAGATACSSSPAAASLVSLGAKGDDIVDTASAAGSFNTLLAAAKAANLVDALKSDGPFTVFAPTDEAFGKLPKAAIADLLQPENRDKLTAILTFHVIEGAMPASEVTRRAGATTINGQRLDFSTKGDAVMIDSAKVIKADIHCSNGIIHVIDHVMMPAGDNLATTATSAGMFTTLLAAAQHAGLADTLANGGPYTVFAPTDEAFGKLPAGTIETLLKPENREMLQAILTYHVVPGRVYANQAAAAGSAASAQGQSLFFNIRNGQLRVDNANIIATDIDASNGVIHVIDSVILPSS